MLADGSEYTGAYVDGVGVAELRAFHRPRMELLAEAGAGELRLRSLDHAIAEVQAIVRGFVPDDVSLVDELIAERRREAEGE